MGAASLFVLVELFSSMQGIEIFQVLDHGGLVQMPWKCHATDLLKDQEGPGTHGSVAAVPVNKEWRIIVDHIVDHG